MKPIPAFVFAVVCLVAAPAACFAQRLYPVQGPATAQTPPPSFTAKLTGLAHGKGNISLVRYQGETFQGTWTTVTAAFNNGKTPGSAESYPPQANLSFAWDLVYGSGFYQTSVLGSQTVGQALAKSPQGTLLQIEFESEKLGMPIDHVFGVAIDNKGNVYKVVL